MNHYGGNEPLVRYWIHDRDHTPQGFPLQQLVRRVREVVKPNDDDYVVTKARGYGIHINQWDEKLDSCEKLGTPFMVLDSLSKGTEEWFFDLEVQLAGTAIVFGLHDSSMLFIEGPARLAEEVAGTFTNYCIDQAKL